MYSYQFSRRHHEVTTTAQGFGLFLKKKIPLYKDEGNGLNVKPSNVKF